LAVAAVWASTGCGTMLDAIVRDYNCGQGSGPLVYGGVRLDANILAAGPEAFERNEGVGESVEVAVSLALWTLDLPVSAAADTLMLPLSIGCAYNRLTAGKGESKSPVAAPSPPSPDRPASPAAP
jgi:uncharacterized protein YceK